jgi:hypothetical protein
MKIIETRKHKAFANISIGTHVEFCKRRGKVVSYFGRRAVQFMNAVPLFVKDTVVFEVQ